MTKSLGLRRAIGVLATSGILAAAMAAVAAGPAAAATLTCGTTITANLTLHHNLNCSTFTTDPAITIGAANLTVNLNGHTITGPGIGTGTSGIYDKGYNGLTITGGTITNFYEDVYVTGSATTSLTGLVVEHLSIPSRAPSYGSDNYGVYGDYLSGASIHNLTISDAYDAIELDNSHNNIVSHNRIVSPEYGLYEYRGAHNTWAHDSVTGVTDEGFYTDYATGTVFKYNHMSGTAGYGVLNYGSTGLSITGNTFGPMYDAIYDDESTGTTVAHNKGSGDTWGIYSYDMTSATYHANTFNRGVFGIETDYPYSETLSANMTNRNSDVGTYVYTDFESGYTATLIHNTANGNRFGLYSQMTTNGSGNHAAHNRVLNCHDVACVKAALRRAALLGAPVHLVPRAPRPPARPARKTTATLTCGADITTSVTLHHNLNCSASKYEVAISIDAADITVNLNGHTITGPGANTPTDGISDTGYSGLTVKGGTITGFGTDLYVSGASPTATLTGIVIEHLTITTGQPTLNAEGYGIFGQYLRGASIHNVTIRDCYYGIELFANTGSIISYSHAVSPEYGLEDVSGTGDTWAHDTVTGALDYAFYIDSTTRTAIRDNHLSGSAAGGVLNYDSTGVSITRNRFGPMYEAVYDDESTGTTVAHNKGSGDTWGIYSYDMTGANYHANTFNGGMFGIETDYPNSGTISANVTNRNSDVGTYVYTDLKSGYTATLIHNTANGNRFGLYSQIATNGSGNHAAHNTVLNCHHVACVKAALRRAALLGAPVHLIPRAPGPPAPGPLARRR
jgi:hypothetical protein